MHSSYFHLFFILFLFLFTSEPTIFGTAILGYMTYPADMRPISWTVLGCLSVRRLAQHIFHYLLYYFQDCHPWQHSDIMATVHGQHSHLNLFSLVLHWHDNNWVHHHVDSQWHSNRPPFILSFDIMTTVLPPFGNVMIRYFLTCHQTASQALQEDAFISVLLWKHGDALPSAFCSSEICYLRTLLCLFWQHDNWLNFDVHPGTRSLI